MPDTPTSWSASLTSSSLNGLMIASIFFTGEVLTRLADLLMPNRRRIGKAVDTRNESHHSFRRAGLAPRPSRRRPAQVPDRLQWANPARPPARHARSQWRARGGGGDRLPRRTGRRGDRAPQWRPERADGVQP